MTAFVADSLKERGHAGEEFLFRPLAGDGSSRRFWRVLLPHRNSSYVAMQNGPENRNSIRENRAYFWIGRHLLAKGIPVPHIYQADLSAGLFFMEDFGDCSLQDASEKPNPMDLYGRVVRTLLRMQVEGSDGFDTGWTSQTERYDQSVMRRHEADYFKDAFLRQYLGFKNETPELEISFDFIIEEASSAPSHFLLHRDFQSRNIMVSDGKIGIIDWQGARLGPLGYDVASLVIDPYPRLSMLQREEIYRLYAAHLEEVEPAFIIPFKKSFPYLALQRNLQILGAFSYLCKTAGKPYFEAYIPTAVESLLYLLKNIPRSELNPLRDLVQSIYDKLQKSKQ